MQLCNRRKTTSGSGEAGKKDGNHDAMRKITNTILATGICTLLLGPGAACAEQASDVVESYIGLESPFRLICTSVNFGVWFLPLGDRGGNTVLDLHLATGTTDTVVSVSGAGSDRAAVIEDTNYTSPLAGVCNVRGSLAANNTALTIAFETDSNVNMAMSPAAHIFAQGLSAAAAEPGLIVNLSAPEAGRASVLTTDGEAVFRVVGTLAIPNNLVRDNYGAYRGSSAATIIVNDGI